MRSIRQVRETKRDREVLEVVAQQLRNFARHDEPADIRRFEFIIRWLEDSDLAYALEALRWEKANGVPWDAGAGVRVLAERGDRQALAILKAADKAGSRTRRRP